MMNGLEQSAGLIFLSAVLVNNLVLDAQLGSKDIMEGSTDYVSAARLAVVSIFLMTTSAPLCYSIDHYLLVPYQLIDLKWLVVPVVLVFLLQLFKVALQRKFSHYAHIFAANLPLLMLNCTVLAVVLLMLENVSSIGQAFIMGLGLSIGFAAVLMLMTGLNQRLSISNIPLPFQGLPIKFITLGILSMAFSGLTS